MFRFPITVFPLVAGMGLLLFTLACVTPIQGLRADPEFTYEAAIAAPMLVGGVVDTLNEPGSVGKRITYGDILSTAFTSERPTYEIDRAGVTPKVLGSENYTRMLDEYWQLGVVGGEWLQRLHNKRDDVRYAIYARIIKDEITYSRTYDDIEEERNVEGVALKFVTGFTARSTIRRELGAQLDIYDVGSGTIVWGGIVTKSTSATKNYEVETPYAYKEIGALQEGNPGESDWRFPYPSMPNKDYLLRSIFIGFGENLPKEGK